MITIWKNCIFDTLIEQDLFDQLLEFPLKLFEPVVNPIFVSYHQQLKQVLDRKHCEPQQGQKPIAPLVASILLP